MDADSRNTLGNATGGASVSNDGVSGRKRKRSDGEEQGHKHKRRRLIVEAKRGFFVINIKNSPDWQHTMRTSFAFQDIAKMHILDISGSNPRGFQRIKLPNLVHLRAEGCGFERFPKDLYKFRKLKTVDLRGNHIAILPKSTTRLTNLTRLDLSDNKYPPRAHGELDRRPFDWMLLRNIRFLNLSGNLIIQKALVHADISHLTRLEKLWINRLSELTNLPTLPPSLKTLKAWQGQLGLHMENNWFNKLLGTSITDLDLSNQKLSYIPAEILQLSQLTTLNLEINPIDEVEYVQQLPNLRELNLRRTSIKNMDLSGLKLKNLCIGEDWLRRISGEVPAQRSKLRGARGFDHSLLQYMRLSRVDKVPNFVFWASGLKSLSLHDSQLPNPIPHILRNVEPATQLTSVYLTKCGLTQIDEQVFCNWPTLENISLNSNSLTTIPSTIGGLPNLWKVDVSKNKLTSLPDELALCRKLTTLWVNDNDMNTLPNGLPHLNTLYTSHNDKLVLPEEGPWCCTIKYFSMEKNLQQVQLPHGFGHSDGFEDLNLHKNALEVIDERTCRLILEYCEREKKVCFSRDTSIQEIGHLRVPDELLLVHRLSHPWSGEFTMKELKYLFRSFWDRERNRHAMIKVAQPWLLRQYQRPVVDLIRSFVFTEFNGDEIVTDYSRYFEDRSRE